MKRNGVCTALQVRAQQAKQQPKQELSARKRRAKEAARARMNGCLALNNGCLALLALLVTRLARRA